MSLNVKQHQVEHVAMMHRCRGGAGISEVFRLWSSTHAHTILRSRVTREADESGQSRLTIYVIVFRAHIYRSTPLGLCGALRSYDSEKLYVSTIFHAILEYVKNLGIIASLMSVTRA